MKVLTNPEIEPVFNFVRVCWPQEKINGLYDPAEIRNWVRGIQDSWLSKTEEYKDFYSRMCAAMIDAAEGAEAYLANHGNIEDDIVKVCEEYQAANPGT